MTIVELNFFPTKFSTKSILFKTDVLILYRNIGTFAIPVWENLNVAPASTAIFGDGSDGNATNPATPGKSLLQYNNLTISSNTTWNLAGYGLVVVLVAGILDISASTTFTITVDSPQDAKGGESVLGPELGGDGRGGGGVVIMAASTTAGATSKIQVDSVTAGGGGDNAAGGGTSIGFDGDTHRDAAQFGSFVGYAERGYGSGAGRPDRIYDLTVRNEPGRGGEDINVSNPLRYFVKIADLLNSHASGGSGGGGGGRGSTDRAIGGAGGGAGGTGAFANGGNGGTGGDGGTPAVASCGGGGGGGASAFLIYVTDAMSANLELEANAGAGGAGGNSTASSQAGNAGGGGGGGAGVLLVAPADLGTRDANGGAAGAAGTGGLGGSAGAVGESISLFKDIDDIIRS